MLKDAFKPTFAGVNEFLRSGNDQIKLWVNGRMATTRESLSKRADDKLVQSFNGLPYIDLPRLDGNPKNEYVAVLTTHKVHHELRTALLQIGEQQLERKGQSIGILTLSHLDYAREVLEDASASDLEELARLYLNLNDFRQKFSKIHESAKKETVALEIARKKAEDEVVSMAIPYATVESLEHFSNQQANGKKTTDERNGSTQFVVNLDGESRPQTEDIFAPLDHLFSRVEETSIDIHNWCGLPIKPLLIPSGSRRESDPDKLAQFLWDSLLYSPQFVDRNGKEVAMDSNSREQYIERIAKYIRQGQPIRASEYTPLTAIPNPLKRRTQSIALADIDFFRRLAEVAKSVELIYPPGLIWEVVNEVPAFVEAFKLDPSYVEEFHKASGEVVNAINHTYGQEVIHLSRMDDFLESDSEGWNRYRTQKSSEMEALLSDQSHPDHKSLLREIEMFVYPMATCINPFSFEASRFLTINQIIAVYERLKLETGSVMRGVGMGRASLTDDLSSHQMELLEWLKQRGRGLSFNYRLTMGAREVLPAFEPMNDTLKYTMVTKPNKPVLYPNSRRGPSFPAHGEPIAILSDKGGWTTVTVKPWVTLLSNRKKYNNTAYVSSTTGDLLYFISAE